MEKLAIYKNGKAAFGWSAQALINVDFAKNRCTTQLNPNFVPHDFEDGYNWDRTPMGDEQAGQFLIVDDDFEVWNNTMLLDEDKQALESGSDELTEMGGMTAIIDKSNWTYFHWDSCSWVPIPT